MAGGAARAADDHARSLRASRRRARCPWCPSAAGRGASFAAERQTRRRQRVRRRGRSRRAPARRRQARARRLLEQRRQASGWPRFSPSTASARHYRVDSLAEVLAAPQSATTFAVLPLETGFEAPRLRRHRRAGHSRRPAGAPHAAQARQRRAHRGVEPRRRRSRGPCRPRHRPLRRARHHRGRRASRTIAWRCIYAGGDKLYLPVENIELLTRYGSDESGVQLDRLGGVAWQSRKARLKQRIRDIAEKLIKVAALRELRQAPVITPPDGRLRRVLGPLPLRGDRGPDHQHRRRARRSRQRHARWTGWSAAMSASARPRWRLRASLRRRAGRQAGGGGGADHAARPPALQHLHRALPRAAR